jgi:ubiquinone/menaquinone biosynthesis C-methylase UbiE
MPRGPRPGGRAAPAHGRAHMADSSTSTNRLTTFYGEMSSLDRILAALAADGVDITHPRAGDLYERDLDCQNLGAHRTLDVLADAVTELATPKPTDTLLDVGCGMGGPGRFLVDRFGCSVLGVDLLPLRIEIAQALTERTGLQDRISYRVADATRLSIDGSVAQVWMLDVGIHIRDKQSLFAEIARALQPGGILVMHDQPGPLPKAMLAVTRDAPFVAPSLPQLIRYVEGAGLRVLRWQDTSALVLEHWREVKAHHQQRAARSPDGEGHPWRERVVAMADAYIETLADLGGRTGILIAKLADGRP